MTKETSHYQSKINQRLIAAPAGAVLTHAWFKAQGISPGLVTYYVRSGWLRRLGEGAFVLKSGSPDWLGAVFGLQQKPGTNLHPGGRTALELSGLAHFLPLGEQAPLYLFSRTGEWVPLWFRHLPWAGRVRHVTTNFLPPDLALREHDAGNFSLRVSTPERAALELLLHQTIDEAGYDDARLLFEGLGSLRSELLQTLLEQCSSVKVKRLLLHLGELHQHAWLNQLDLTKVTLGSGKRVLVRGGRLDPKYLITVPAPAEIPADAP
jgi:hypothetical protein